LSSSASSSISTNAYFVATDGSDSNPGTKSSPFRTIKKGLSVLRAGYTLYIRAGTWREGTYTIDTHETLGFPITGGTSFSNGAVISGYPGDPKPVIDGNVRLGGFGDTRSPYVTLKDLIIDGSKVTENLLQVNAHHQRLDGVELRNLQGAIHTIFVSVSGDNVEFLNCSIHDGMVSGPEVGRNAYGWYASAQNMIIDNCDVYNLVGYGLHLYDSGSTRVSKNIIRNSRFSNTGITSAVQILLSSGSNNEFYNNVVHQPSPTTSDIRRSGVFVDYNCSNCKVYGNTIYGHDDVGVGVMAAAVNTTVKDNRVYQNNPNIVNYGSGTFLSNNLTTPPLFP
jgi:parallel beta-helix repeat protein